MIKRLNSRFKYLRKYLRDFRGNLFLKEKKNLKFFKYLLEKRQLRFEKKKNIRFKNIIRLNLTKTKTFKGNWGVRRGRKSYRKTIFLNKQAFRHFYTTLRERQIKKYLQFAHKSRESFWKIFFLYIELRLDVLLYRLNFFEDLQGVKEWLSSNYVTLNGKPVSNRSVRLKVGDLLEIPFVYKREFFEKLKYRMGFYHPLVKGRYRRNTIMAVLPPFIEGNYKILSFIVRSLPGMKTYFTPSKFNLYAALSYYRF